MSAYLTNIFLLIVLSASAYADTIYLKPISSGTARDIDSDGIFDLFTPALTTGLLTPSPTTGLSPNQRSVFEFDTTEIPYGAVIHSATFMASKGISTVIGVQDEMLLTHGFIGNGTAELADASMINQLGKNYFFQSPLTDVTAFLSSNIGHQFLGFSLHSNKIPGQAGNTSGIILPSLKVEFTQVPEPSSMIMILLGLAGTFVRKEYLLKLI